MNLLCAKSRVAPLKELDRQEKDDMKPAELTTPRLELFAALLLAQQIAKVTEALEIDVNRVVLWSDSTIVLGWIEYLSQTFPSLSGTVFCKFVSWQGNSNGSMCRQMPIQRI